MKVIIDRFEGDYAVVEVEEGCFVDMPKVLIPDAKEGDVVSIQIDKNKTKEREKHVENLINQLFQD